MNAGKCPISQYETSLSKVLLADVSVSQGVSHYGIDELVSISSSLGDSHSKVVQQTVD